MGAKLGRVKEGVMDVWMSLNWGGGENEFGMCIFGGKREEVEVVVNWRGKVEWVCGVFGKVWRGGMSGRGPAMGEGREEFERIG